MTTTIKSRATAPKNPTSATPPPSSVGTGAAQPVEQDPAKGLEVITKKINVKEEGLTAPGTHDAPLEGSIVPANAPSSSKLSPSEKKDYARNRRIIRVGLDSIYKGGLDVGAAILEVDEKHLYREEHKNISEFCAREFKLAKTRAYYLRDAARVLREFSSMEEKPPLPKNERQIRPLTKLKTPELRAEAWKRALILGGKGGVTGAIVSKAVKQVLGTLPAEEMKEADAVEVRAWRTPLIVKLKKNGFEAVFEQPIKWSTDSADMFSVASQRYVKFIDELTFDSAASAMALRQKSPTALIVINAAANTPEGLLYSNTEEIVECFSKEFNVMATLLGAFLEDEETIYEAGEMDESSEVVWKPLHDVDFTTMGLPGDEAAAAE